MFKSYYVVWKQKMKTVIRNHSQSLNRTMQYGNDDECVYVSREFFV